MSEVFQFAQKATGMGGESSQPVDFRKQINGLSVLVEEQLAKDPFDEALLVFINRGRNGFCLWLKRLEKDRFAWPKQLDASVL